MPHYADGTEARIGDRVQGPCHNFPSNGPAIQGVVTGITPGAETCNCTITYPVAVAQPGEAVLVTLTTGLCDLSKLSKVSDR